jgi:hypothetical protein
VASDENRVESRLTPVLSVAEGNHGSRLTSIPIDPRRLKQVLTQIKTLSIGEE